MKFILSPSKRQELSSLSSVITTTPTFIKEAEELGQMMAKLSPKQLENRLGLSKKLGEEVHHLWSRWGERTSPALSQFRGDVYDGLDLFSLNSEQQGYALNNSIILSALYGVLRGSDVISPYRLDLNDKVKKGNKSLTMFWKTKVKSFPMGEGSYVDLTSSEYTPLIPLISPERLIRVDFKEEKNGTLKTVSFFSKKARGTFAKWMIIKKPEDFESLKNFNEDGYLFNHEASTTNLYIFSR